MLNDAELTFNAALTAEIEALGFTVFPPGRDGVERAKEPWASMPRADLHRAIFAGDRDAVLASDVLPVVLDGASVTAITVTVGQFVPCSAIVAETGAATYAASFRP